MVAERANRLRKGRGYLRYSGCGRNCFQIIRRFFPRDSNRRSIGSGLVTERQVPHVLRKSRRTTHRRQCNLEHRRARKKVTKAPYRARKWMPVLDKRFKSTLL